MKPTLVFGLLAFWVFALVTPSVITILEKSGSVATFSLQEEEQKETVSLDADQKQLSRTSAFSVFILPVEDDTLESLPGFTLSNPYLEIVLPPPELRA